MKRQRYRLAVEIYLMRKLKIDFAERMSWARRGSLILLFAVAIAGAYLGKIYYDLSTDLAVWEAKWRAAEDVLKAVPNATGNKEEMERSQTEIAAAKRIATRLALPWDVLFQEIDGSIGEQVTLLGIEPDIEKKELRIAAEARNLAAMLEYEKRLQTSMLFKNVHVASHHVQLQDPQRPVRFILQAGWLLDAGPRNLSTHSSPVDID